MKSEIRISGGALRMTRIFDAPRQEVFGWWAEAEKLAQWSGCREATRCEVEMDFRVGGSFTQKMHLAGKGDFTVTGTYEEISVPERIAYRAHLGPAVTHVTVEFFVEHGSTRVVLTHSGFPDEMTPKFVSQGTDESFERLDSLLGLRKGVSA